MRESAVPSRRERQDALDALPVLHEPIAAEEPLAVGRLWRVDDLNEKRLQLRGIRLGEAFTLRDAGGAWFRARLERPLAPGPARRAMLFEAIACPESPLRLALLQAILDRERNFWVVQKATELGAEWILPLFTARSLGPGALAREKAHRWSAAILRAVAQCRRGSVPVLLPPVPLAEALALPLWREAEARWAMVEPGQGGTGRRGDGATGRRGDGAEGQPSVRSAALLVGPEGGWTPEEVAGIREAGALPVRLGGRVLRAETAALAGLTALQLLYGDLQPG
jgi:16S rRNA (uracil1498-N3)-methyltransferase